MGVSCQILLNKPNGVQRPGQLVSGVVKYALNEPLQVKSVVLSLIGKGHCSWSETRASSNRTEIVSYKGSEEYFTAVVDVIQKTRDEVIIIPVGTYEFVFEFLLPMDIPPSFKDDIGHISYELLLKFKRPGIFKFNRKFTTEVAVQSCIDEEAEVPLVFELEKVLTKLFSKRKHVVNVKMEINKTYFTPEEKADLTFIVTNDTSVNIIAIKSELIRYTTYTADSGQTKVVMTVLKGSTVQSESVPKKSIANLRQEISILPDMYSVNSRLIKVEYKLRVIVRLPVPHANASLEIPLVIGEKSVVERLQRDPPSYWEVMCVEEKGTE